MGLHVGSSSLFLKFRKCRTNSLLLRPLLKACSKNIYFDMVHELIKNGADVNASDCTRQTSLHMVVYRNNMDVTNLLLQNKANVNSVDKFKVTPLMAAAERGNSDLLELLLKHGACPNMTDMGFRTALDGAILENSRKVQKRHCCLLLICYGAVIREGILKNLKKCHGPHPI